MRRDSMPSRKTRSCACFRRTRGISAAPRVRSASHALHSIDECRSMAFSRFRVGVALRVGALFLTIAAAAWLIAAGTQWYVLTALAVGASLAQAVMLAQFATRSSREMARLLDAIAVDDTSPSFSALSGDS